MDAFTAITTALGGLKTATDLATGMRKALAAHELKLEEVPGKIMELQGFIMDSRTALGNAEDELRAKKQIHQLETDNAELRGQLAKKAQGRKHDNAAWKVLEDGTEEGPYCPNCWEKSGHFIQGAEGAINDGYQAFFCGEHGKPGAFVFRVPANLCANLLPKKPARSRPPQPGSPWS